MLEILRSYSLVLSLYFIGGFFSYSYAQANEITLIASPKVLAINIIDNNESMVDLRNQKEIAYGPSPEIPNNKDYTKLRKTVYTKLRQAQSLLPKGLHLCLYEGYRSLQLQKTLFDKRFQKVQEQHPTWSTNEVFTETTKLVSPVINLDGSKNIPPHSTGSAIDVYLIDDAGKSINMGIHPKDWVADVGSVSTTMSRGITPEAQKNRKIMSTVLAAVGFVNYPTEYWHWSYGDRYWAYMKNKPNAIYGNIK